jgi:4-hydroxymandelate oxidase
MNRRGFTQFLTLGAGLVGLAPARAQGRNETAEVPPASPAKGAAPRASAPVTVEEFKELARARLPAATFAYITSGSADELTLRENLAAFGRLKILPPLLTGVAKADLATTVLTQRVSLPVLLAPVAAQRMYHPQGALAAARAAAAAGTVFGVSSSAGNSAEEIAAAGEGPKWFQLYMPRDRAVARQLVARVERAGYRALILTVDLGEWKDADRRNRFALPREMLVKHLRDVGFAQVTERMSHRDVLAFNEHAWDGALTWDCFDWLRSITKLPLLIKGVLRVEDAKKAVALGLDGIIVSNHGGRRLDGMPASIEVLPRIAEAVAGRVEVYLDSGVRRGTDVLKALALGARAVLIGRPYAWALAAAGEEGVRQVIELLREELVNAMLATGCARVSDVNPGLVIGH